MKCEGDNCSVKYPSFNYPDQTQGAYCWKHQKPDMVSVVNNKKCKHEGCLQQPSFNKEGQSKAMYCKKHKESGMINVISKTCQEAGCTTTSPSFNKPGQSKGVYCSEHKKPEMVNVVEKRNCKETGCSVKNPSYNNLGETKGLYCSEHKKPRMIDVKHPKCQEDGCLTGDPSFNKQGQSKGLYCEKHKKAGMINVITKKRCNGEGCMSQSPSFNYPGQKQGLYCKECKQPGMTNVKSQTCKDPGCNSKTPSFNYPGEVKGKYCKKHKKDGMLGIKCKKCVQCTAEAQWGKSEFNRPQWCAQHKPDNAVDIAKERRCQECDEDYVFLIDNTKFCGTHCPESSYMEMTKRLCKFCDIREGSAWICVDCRRTPNRKEWAVVRELRRKIKIPFVHDVTVDSECSLRRPDAYFDMQDKAIIVEIDEFQHKQYAEECECARISELVCAIGGRPLTIIRYNPDSVKWKNGIVYVDPASRIDLLIEVVKEELSKTPTEFKVEVIQLWYDDDLEEEYQKLKRDDITRLVAV